MKITVLVENNSRIDNYLLSEPALSLYIEEDKKKILFDVGYSEAFLKNAKFLNVNLNEITDIIISHGHNDHTGGLKFLNLPNKNINFIAHPNIFDEKVDNDKIHYGCTSLKTELTKKYNLCLSKVPVKITERLYFLGEIRNNISIDIDDSALVYIMSKGLFIITGCSHSGIINIINYAKSITKINVIYGVLGGFHLIDKTNEQIKQLANFFKKEDIKFLAPCHCCDLNSKILLSHYLPLKEICTGDVIVLK